MALKINNTLSREKEIFKPVNEGRVNMYVCGVTVYDHCHLGHAKNAISFDIVSNYLRKKGYEVVYICNITDVGHIVDDEDEGEDKIIKRAKERKLHPMELVDFYIKSMWDDFDCLRIDRPNISPRATGHIVEIIEEVQKILDKGYAYEVNGSVYFDIDKFMEENPDTDFGKLSRRKLEKLQSGTRVAVKEEKKNPYDFALWKKAEPNHILQWKSPWGMGYPGWHIECSVMGTKYLGQPFDIHGGGNEHAMLHHECEVAQAEAANDKRFVNYWIHTGMLTVDNQKMSKSKHNFITIKDALAKHSPEAIRMLMSQTHYSSVLNYTQESIEAAENAVEKLSNFVQSLKDADSAESENFSLENFKQRFYEYMDDDFNAPQAMAELFIFINDVNKELAEGKVSKQQANKILDFIDEIDDIFKIVKPKSEAGGEELASEILKLREEFRQNKNFDVADKIRDAVTEAGFKVEDKKDSTRIKY